MEIQKQISGETLTLSIKGEIDKITSPVLEESILLSIDTITDLILDFKEVAYISSACLRVLLSVQKKINVANKTMKIINSNDTVREVFTMAGFNKYINIL